MIAAPSRRAALCLLPLLIAPSFASAAARSVVGQDGASVQVPAHPQRIADLWFAHAALMLVLGASDRIAMTTDTEAREPWMFRVAPALDRAVQLEAPVPGAETLLGARIDLAIATPGSPAAAVARSAGLPSATVAFHDARGLVDSVDFTAELLNDPAARERARAFRSYVDQIRAQVAARTDGLPDSLRPRVLHIQSLHPLKVDGAGTIIDDWIRAAGGRNAAVGVSGFMREVSVEQVAAWNPDVLIVDSHVGTIDPRTAGALWRGLSAVRAGRVFTNPHGVFTWDRYGVEYPLQLLWAARTLHPELFADTDLVQATQRFYRQFFACELTAAEARLILAARRPDGTSFSQTPHGPPR